MGRRKIVATNIIKNKSTAVAEIGDVADDKGVTQVNSVMLSDSLADPMAQSGGCLHAASDKLTPTFDANFPSSRTRGSVYARGVPRVFRGYVQAHDFTGMSHDGVVSIGHPTKLDTLRSGANIHVMRVWGILHQDFSGGSISAATASIGTALPGSTAFNNPPVWPTVDDFTEQARFGRTWAIGPGSNAAGAYKGFDASEQGTSSKAGYDMQGNDMVVQHGIAGIVVSIPSVTGGTISDFTAGKLEIFVWYLEMPNQGSP